MGSLLFGSLRGYRRTWLAGDVVAGLTVWAVLPGLFIGIAASLLLLYRVSRPHVAVLARVPGTHDHYVDVERHPEDEPPADVAILRVESGLIFANAEHVRDVIRAHATDGVRGIVLDAETVPSIDVSAARMLSELRSHLERDDVQLVIARDVGQVRDVLRTSGPDGPLLPTYPTVHEAVEAVRELHPDRVMSAHPPRT